MSYLYKRASVLIRDIGTTEYPVLETFIVFVMNNGLNGCS